MYRTTRSTLLYTMMLLFIYFIGSSAAQAQPLSNTRFDTDVTGWFPDISSSIDWNPLDADANPASSGSGLVTNLSSSAGDSSGARQCANETTEGETYFLGAEVYIPSGQTETGWGDLLVQWFSEAGCSGSQIGLFITSAVPTSTPDLWLPVIGLPVAPAGSKSARVRLSVRKDAGVGSLAAHFDNVLFFSTALDDPAIFISNISGGYVAVIDVLTDSMITSIDTGTTPAEIARLGALNRAFVPDITDGTVSVIDTFNREIVDTIQLGSPAAAADANEITGNVYVLDFSNGAPGTHLHVVDADTNTETADVPIGSHLQNIAVDSSADRAYATDFVEGVVVVDTTSNTVSTTIPLTDLPHGVAVNPDTSSLYVTHLDSDTVTVLDTGDYSEIAILAVGDTPQWIKLDTPRNKAFVTNEGDGTVSVIDLSTNTVLPGPIPVGVNPLTVTIHSGAAKAYVYNMGDSTVSVIDTVGNVVIATIDLTAIFEDGFESGDTSAWSTTMP